tara:strand:- start:1066 stop:1332 length:267 start_codon:yes stop_codon:yes gene_type:complete
MADKKTQKEDTPNWDAAPAPMEVDLSTASADVVSELLKSHIDEAKAQELIQRMDGSAGNYEQNIARIQQWVQGVQGVVGTAIKIAAVV